MAVREHQISSERSQSSMVTELFAEEGGTTSEDVLTNIPAGWEKMNSVATGNPVDPVGGRKVERPKSGDDYS